MFLEYLHENSISDSNIENYLSAIKTVTAKYGLPVSHFFYQRIQMFIRALKINRPVHLTTVSHLDEKVLEKILQQRDKYNHPQIYKSLYSLAFFSFLRISNILPHSVPSFDGTRQLCRGDIIFTPRVLPYLLNGPRPFKIGGRFEPLSFLGWVLPLSVL